MVKTKKKQVALERFQGLSKKQVRALIEIDELASHAHDQKLIAEVIKALGEAGIPFTKETMRFYAQQAEACERFGVAGAWYQFLMLAGEELPLREFVIKHGFLREARDCFKDLCPDELQGIGKAHLKRRGCSEGGLETALKAFQLCKYEPGMRLVLRQAVREGFEKLAEETARALGRVLTRKEWLTLARRQLKHDWPSNELAETIIHRNLSELKRPFINHAIRDGVAYERLLKWARLLQTKLTTQDLERLFNKYAKRGTHAVEAVEVADILAKRSVKWRRELPEILEWARNQQLGWREPESAEELGQRCGKPLTVEELLNLAETFRTEQELDWARKRRAFCFALAAKRIAEQVNPPPKRLKVA